MNILRTAKNEYEKLKELSRMIKQIEERYPERPWGTSWTMVEMPRRAPKTLGGETQISSFKDFLSLVGNGLIKVGTFLRSHSSNDRVARYWQVTDVNYEFSPAGPVGSISLILPHASTAKILSWDILREEIEKDKVKYYLPDEATQLELRTRYTKEVTETKEKEGVEKELEKYAVESATDRYGRTVKVGDQVHIFDAVRYITPPEIPADPDFEKKVAEELKKVEAVVGEVLAIYALGGEVYFYIDYAGIKKYVPQGDIQKSAIVLFPDEDTGFDGWSESKIKYFVAAKFAEAMPTSETKTEETIKEVGDVVRNYADVTSQTAAKNAALTAVEWFESVYRRPVPTVEVEETLEELSDTKKVEKYLTGLSTMLAGETFWAPEQYAKFERIETLLFKEKLIDGK